MLLLLPSLLVSRRFRMKFICNRLFVRIQETIAVPSACFSAFLFGSLLSSVALPVNALEALLLGLILVLVAALLLQ